MLYVHTMEKIHLNHKELYHEKIYIANGLGDQFEVFKTASNDKAFATVCSKMYLLGSKNHTQPHILYVDHYDVLLHWVQVDCVIVKYCDKMTTEVQNGNNCINLIPSERLMLKYCMFAV